MKYLLLFILIVGVIWYFFRPRERKMDSDLMLECLNCGIYVSSKEALRCGNEVFCSRECRQHYRGK